METETIEQASFYSFFTTSIDVDEGYLEDPKTAWDKAEWFSRLWKTRVWVVKDGLTIGSILAPQHEIGG